MKERGESLAPHSVSFPHTPSSGKAVHSRDTVLSSLPPSMSTSTKPTSLLAKGLERKKSRGASGGAARRQAAHSFLSSISLGDETTEPSLGPFSNESTTSSLPRSDSLSPTSASNEPVASQPTATAAFGASVDGIPVHDAVSSTPRSSASDEVSSTSRRSSAGDTAPARKKRHATTATSPPDEAVARTLSAESSRTLSTESSASADDQSIATGASTRSSVAASQSKTSSTRAPFTPLTIHEQQQQQQQQLLTPDRATASPTVFRKSSMDGTVMPPSSSSTAATVGQATPLGVAQSGRTSFVFATSLSSLRFGTAQRPARLLLTSRQPSEKPSNPCGAFSYIRYDANHSVASKRTAATSVTSRATASTAPEAAALPSRALSYEHMFSRSGAEEDGVRRVVYDPHLLDDPQLQIGKHRQLITLPSFLGSFIRYTRAADLRKALNEKFREEHPDLDPSMTLSKLHRIKENMIAVAEELELEAHAVAAAYVYFERLMLKNVVNKANRRAIAGACLLLAVKAGDLREQPSVALPKITEAIERHMEVSSKAVIANEFTVFAALDFDLSVPLEAVMPHFTRVISALDCGSMQEYLGEPAYLLFKSTSS